MIKTLAILGLISTTLVGCMVAPYDDRPNQGRYDRNGGHYQKGVYQKDNRHPSYNRGNSAQHRNDGYKRPDAKWQQKKDEQKKWEKDRKQWEKDRKRDYRR